MKTFTETIRFERKNNMNISFDGFEENCLTFAAGEGLEAGELVIPGANGVIEKSGEGDEFCGIALKVKDGYATVQLHGIIRVPCAATVTAPGYYYLVADEDGKVAPADTGLIYRLVLTVTDGVAELLL